MRGAGRHHPRRDPIRCEIVFGDAKRSGLRRSILLHGAQDERRLSHPYRDEGARVVLEVDGQHSVEAIVAALAGDVDALQVHFALAFLERRGHVVEADDGAPPARAAFWDALGADARQAERRLRETTVALRGIGIGLIA